AQVALWRPRPVRLDILVLDHRDDPRSQEGRARAFISSQGIRRDGNRVPSVGRDDVLVRFKLRRLLPVERPGVVRRSMALFAQSFCAAVRLSIGQACFSGEELMEELARYYLAQGKTVRAAGLMLTLIKTE